MSGAREHIYFADLNCPFCYALDERILELGLAEQVVWQGIQHLHTVEQWKDITPARLAEEVGRLAQLAPDLPIRVPPRLPPTGLPILALAEIGLTDAAAAARVRRGLHRALWIEGHDISSPAVIGEVCRSLGLALPKPSANARALVSR